MSAPEGPMRPGDPARGGATWCGEHGRWECVKRVKASRGGGRCHGPAIIGVDRCRMHGGKSADLLKAEGEAITAWSAAVAASGRPGKPVVSTAEAVLGMLQMSWLRADVYAGLLEQQVAEAQADGSGGGPPGVGVGAGLIGHTLSGVRDIGIFATGEALRGLVQLEAAERDRCVRFAKTAHDMKIDEAQIKIAETQGALLAGVISRVLDALELTAEQRIKVPEIVPRELRAVAGGEIR